MDWLCSGMYSDHSSSYRRSDAATCLLGSRGRSGAGNRAIQYDDAAARNGSRAVQRVEILPDPSVRSREEIAQFVCDQARGHHASCTCKIGRREDAMAVVDSRFGVHCTRNLRVVDASVFPRIPGYFILMPIYIISEKGTHVILEDAKVKGSLSQGNISQAKEAKRSTSGERYLFIH